MRKVQGGSGEGYLVERSDDYGDTWVPLMGPRQPNAPDGEPVTREQAEAYATEYRGGLSRRAPVRLRIREEGA